MVDNAVQSTTDILQEINAAEAQAAEIKRRASEDAARIYAEAETQAANMEKNSADVCKAYADTQMKTARAQAEAAYERTVENKRKEAQDYCASVLEERNQQLVSEIVGRIIRGNC